MANGFEFTTADYVRAIERLERSAHKEVSVFMCGAERPCNDRVHPAATGTNTGRVALCFKSIQVYCSQRKEFKLSEVV